MQTLVQTPLALFTVPQRLLVPLFQRPYVWDEEDQWKPLWEDIRRHAERRLVAAGVPSPHFLGAVVLQGQPPAPGALPQLEIIDGQQRLTTLQLVFDAAHAVMAELGHQRIGARLVSLTANDSAFVVEPEDTFKVWPTNRDRAAYAEVLSAEPPVKHDELRHRKSRLAHAHAYFSTAIRTWLLENGSEDLLERCDHLTTTLTSGLSLVTITLEASEDSQTIFETLNDRGTPLTAADLIKNFVFQRLTAEGVDPERAYHEHWELFERPFWEEQIGVGRYLVSRSSLFLNQWLQARVGEEVSPRATFTRFKQYVEHDSNASMAAMLPLLHRQATDYESWLVEAGRPDGDLDPIAMAVYRTQTANLELLKPILLWLHDPELMVPAGQRVAVVRAVESWLMRRALLRLPTADLGRVVADIIQTSRDAEPDTVGERVTSHLSRLDRMSTYWPGDAELRRALQETAAYRRYPRARLRMFLEAVEDHVRGYTRGHGRALADSRVRRGQLHIEHLLPQRWRETWPVSGLAEEVDRDAHVHRLGNLTLLTSSLNGRVSNGPWLGTSGKLAHLTRHDVVLCNRWVRERGADGWDEGLIDERTALLIDALLETWPVPAGHLGDIADSTVPESAGVDFRDLVASGAVPAGTVLQCPQGAGTVLPDGRIQVGEQVFWSPSGAGGALSGKATNGWYHWRMPDGRRLRDVREEYRKQAVSP